MIRTKPLEPCWRELCRARWADKPRYALTPEREAFLARASFAMPQSWRARYDFFERDRQRAFLSADELEGLHWHFNFTPAAGGRGRASLQRVQFDGRCLRVPGFPPLPYILEPRAADGSALDADDEEAGEGPAAGTFAMMRDMLAALPELPQQRLLIANFPPHVVSRLDSDWEWLITNDNVTLVSSGTDDVVAYDERSFQTPPAPDHPMLRASTCDAIVLNSDYRFCDRSTRPTQTHGAARGLTRRRRAMRGGASRGGRRSCRGRRARRGGRPPVGELDDREEHRGLRQVLRHEAGRVLAQAERLESSGDDDGSAATRAAAAAADAGESSGVGAFAIDDATDDDGVGGSVRRFGGGVGFGVGGGGFGDGAGAGAAAGGAAGGSAAPRPPPQTPRRRA